MTNDERFMEEALKLARRAERHDDVPVGAVIVREGRVIARGMNTREQRGDPTGHAEINAIRKAARRTGCWRLHGCTLYVTLEPCPMCAGAAVNARIDRVVFGASDPKAGAFGGRTDLNAAGLNHRPDVCGGVMRDECAGVLKEYFKKKRAIKKAVL